jgi:hypothetical protein
MNVLALQTSCMGASGGGTDRIVLKLIAARVFVIGQFSIINSVNVSFKVLTFQTIRSYVSLAAHVSKMKADKLSRLLVKTCWRYKRVGTNLRVNAPSDKETAILAVLLLTSIGVMSDS